jgi:predicted nucleic acid-binding protein
VLYAFDSNIYIAAQRSPRERAIYDRMLIAVGRNLRLPAVVALELRAGVRNADHQNALEHLVQQFEQRDRVLVPSMKAFIEAGRVLADLSIREGYTYGRPPRSLTNDALIAASCREARVTLATNNQEDFARIQRHLRGFRFVIPAAIGA